MFLELDHGDIAVTNLSPVDFLACDEVLWIGLGVIEDDKYCWRVYTVHHTVISQGHR